MKEKEIAVSVIIPHYNRPALLKEAVDSVLAQGFRDFELIIADDGSTDESLLYLEALAESLPEVKILNLPHSGFPGAVRNSGAAAARGRWLAFLDSDDLWTPEKLARQAAFFAANPSVRICHTREVWLREGRTISQKGQKHQRGGDIFFDALKKCIIGPSTVMMEASLYRETGGFAEDLEIAEDYEYWLRITAREPVGYIDEPLTVKRAGGWPQLSEKYGQIEVFRIEALKRFLENPAVPALENPPVPAPAAAPDLPPEKLDQARRVLAEKCRIYAAGCEKRGRLDEAAAYLLLAMSCLTPPTRPISKSSLGAKGFNPFQSSVKNQEEP